MLNVLVLDRRAVVAEWDADVGGAGDILALHILQPVIAADTSLPVEPDLVGAQVQRVVDLDEGDDGGAVAEELGTGGLLVDPADAGGGQAQGCVVVKGPGLEVHVVVAAGRVAVLAVVGVEADGGERVDEGGGEGPERAGGQVLLHQSSELEDLGLGLIGVAVVMVVAGRRAAAMVVVGMAMAVVAMAVTMGRLEGIGAVAR